MIWIEPHQIQLFAAYPAFLLGLKSNRMGALRIHQLEDVIRTCHIEDKTAFLFPQILFACIGTVIIKIQYLMDLWIYDLRCFSDQFNRIILYIDQGNQIDRVLSNAVHDCFQQHLFRNIIRIGEHFHIPRFWAGICMHRH